MKITAKRLVKNVRPNDCDRAQIDISCDVKEPNDPEKNEEWNELMCNCVESATRFFWLFDEFNTITFSTEKE